MAPPQINSMGSVQVKGCHILVSQFSLWNLPGTHFTDPWWNGRLSQPAGSLARTRHFSDKSHRPY